MMAQVLIRAMELGPSLQCLSGRASYESIEGMKDEHDREPTPDETAGMVWWNSLTEADARRGWCGLAAPFQPMPGWRTSGSEMLIVSRGS
jgi:hypothetical protein